LAISARFQVARADLLGLLAVFPILLRIAKIVSCVSNERLNIRYCLLMKKHRSLYFVGIALLVAAGTAISQSSKRPVNWEGLPDPFHTPSASNRPKVVERPNDASLSVPPGFHVEEYMSGFEARPRFMILGPNQEILLTDSGARRIANGRVYVIRDKTAKKIIEGLDRPYGLAMHEDWLYVAEPTSVKRYKYDAQNMTVEGSGEEIISLEGHGTGHWTRTLLFDQDHKKLYTTVGSGSNIDLGEDPKRATVLRSNPDGSDLEVVATGLRNTIGLRWFPGSDSLWGAVQERDGLGDDLANDFLVNIQQGAFYGWPYAYNGPHEEPRHKDVAPGKVKNTRYPDVLLGAHVAVLDILFYTGKQFPEEYRNGLFLAFHGSWNRSKRTGYSVTYIPFKKGQPTSGPQDFLRGWMLGEEQREVWGRPVGLLQMPDGSVLVSDDGGRKLWRISYVG
jgi:glucose/arabinose dehydrogenase